MLPTVLNDSPNKIVSKIDAYARASTYATNQIDPSFDVRQGTRLHHKPLGKAVWQFILCAGSTPLHPLYVDAQTGAIIPLTKDESRSIRQRAAIAAVETQAELPVDDRGYILTEFARRKTNAYLSREVSLFCGATDGVFIPLERAIWQFAIRFNLPRHGELGILGTIDVDACSGEVIPLLPQQIEQLNLTSASHHHTLISTIPARHRSTEYYVSQPHP